MRSGSHTPEAATHATTIADRSKATATVNAEAHATAVRSKTTATVDAEAHATAVTIGARQQQRLVMLQPMPRKERNEQTKIGKTTAN